MSVLSIGDARKHLNISGTVHDDELAGVIASAEAVIANHVGPLEPTPVTVLVRGGSWLALPVLPVVSVTSIVPQSGNALVVSDTRVDSVSGLVTYLSSGRSFSSVDHAVTYVAGRAVCPPDLLLAVKELVRHLWESQRTPARPVNPLDSGPAQVPGAAYLLPYRVQELLAPHIQVAVA